MPKVSVIIPVYNAADVLMRCMDSIMAQVLTDFEVIIVNDGSTDASGEVCDRCAAKDARIMVVHKENGGVSSARNAGLDVALGQYVCFFDADDMVEPVWLSDMVEAADAHPGALVSCNIDIHEPDRRYLRYNGFSGEMSLQRYLGVGDWGHLWSKIFRRDVIESLHIRFNTGMKVHEDETFVGQYASACSSAYVCERVGYHYLNTVLLAEKYADCLTVDNTYREYLAIKKYSRMVSRYIVDRLLMEVLDSIDRAPEQFDDIVERLRETVGGDIRYVNGGRKCLFRLLSHTLSPLAWRSVFKIYKSLNLL